MKYLAKQLSWALAKINVMQDKTKQTGGLKKGKRGREDGGEIGGSRVHFPSTPVKHLADLRSRANSQRYSSIYEDRRPKIEDIERSDGKKSA